MIIPITLHRNGRQQQAGAASVRRIAPGNGYDSFDIEFFVKPEFAAQVLGKGAAGLERVLIRIYKSKERV